MEEFILKVTVTKFLTVTVPAFDKDEAEMKVNDFLLGGVEDNDIEIRLDGEDIAFDE